MAKSPARNTNPDDLTDDQERELADDMAAAWVQSSEDSAFESEEAARRAWTAHGGRITVAYAAENPGRRPPGWWRFETPRDRPVFADDRPDGAPRDLCNESAWLLELGELGDGERERAPGPNPAQQAVIEANENRESSDISGD